METNITPLYPPTEQAKKNLNRLNMQEKPEHVALNPAGEPGWLFRCLNTDGHQIEFCRATVPNAVACLREAYSRGYKSWCRVWIHTNEPIFHECTPWEMAMKLQTIFPLGKYVVDIDE